MNTKKIILSYLSESLSGVLNPLSESLFESAEEIRIRIGKPILIYQKGKEYTVTDKGQLMPNTENGYKPTQKDVSQTIELMSNYSLYAFEEELRNGYITLIGGHRIGISGKTVIEKASVRTIKNICSLNIRISHEIKGSANKVINYIIKPDLMHTMIISPPACGKTTLLRDLVRILSDGIQGGFKGITVGLVDERSEIAGCFMGVPQNDVGVRTDVLDACPKAEGMLMLLRSMSPKVIAVDEIGKEKDIYAIEEIINAGIKLICTVHGKSLLELRQKPVLSGLINKNIFNRYILLGNRNGPGTILNIYNEKFEDVFI